MPKADEKKQLEKLGKTDATLPAVTGRWVRDSLVMSDGEVKFSWRQYRFANIYRKTLDLEAACAEAGMVRESAIRFLRRPDVRAWLADREQMQETKRKWSAEGRWWHEGDRMFHEEQVPKHRVAIWESFGERLEIKPSRNADAGKDSVQINISAEVLSSIRERERAVEAEIVNRTNGQ